MEERKYKITATFSEAEFRQIARKAYDSRCSKGAIVARLVVAAMENEEEERQG